MFRPSLIPLLSGRSQTLRELARHAGVKPTELEDDLRHLAKSLAHREWKLMVTPAVCRKCGFRFGPDKLHKPSKCPTCHATWLTEPLIGIVSRD